MPSCRKWRQKIDRVVLEWHVRLNAQNTRRRADTNVRAPVRIATELNLVVNAIWMQLDAQIFSIS